jgi:RNA 3'-terminal phosphate cyclase (ATP)
VCGLEWRARTGETASRVVVQGGTHVPLSPPFPYLSRHWSPVVARIGLETQHELEESGFQFDKH